MSCAAEARPYHKLTESDVERIIELREKGYGTDRLAAMFGCSPGAIAYQCLKNGAASPRQRRSKTHDRSVTVARGAGSFRTFSIEEDRKLLALEAEGIGYSEIARRMGRARTSCRMRLMRLALDEEICG